jgi:CubicO group peptidase (beta-lactamase class C family)
MTLTARLTALQRAGRLPSVVAGVLRDGALVESAGVLGEVGTAYRIGSITKTLTAVLVLQLRDEGLLGLDDPVGQHLPGVGYADLTIADLLGHTGGMQSEPTGPWWERTDGGSFDELVAANDAAGAVAGRNEWFHYSNLGYGLLGEVVTRLRGGTWWDVVRTRLLEPLDMTRTTWGPVEPHAHGHSVVHLTGMLDDEPHTDTGAMAPAGQLWSTIADLAVWTAVLAGRHPEVLSPGTASEMATPRLDPGYGLGLRLVDVDGRQYVGHTGSMPGFLASLFVDPATGDGTVVLANGTTGLDADGVPAALLTGAPPTTVEPWVPTIRVPDWAQPLLGFWFWGNTATEWRWQDERLEVRMLQNGTLAHAFARRGDGRIVGVSGYHRGEKLHVHDGHLECATFRYTRTPYDTSSGVR